MGERRPADAAEALCKVVAMLGGLKDLSKQRVGAREELGRAHFGLGMALQQMGKTFRGDRRTTSRPCGSSRIMPMRI